MPAQVLLVNVLLFLVAAAVIISTALLLDSALVQDFESEEYQDYAAILIVLGVLLFFLSCCGCLGAVYQTNSEGLVHGPRMLGLHQLGMIGAAGAQVFVTTKLLLILQSLSKVEIALESGEELWYGSFESYVSAKYNTYFFSTTDSQGRHATFWSFVDENCPESMHSGVCDGETPSSCDADISACDANIYGEACPYQMCRLPLVNEMLARISPCVMVSVFVMIFQAVALTLTCLLVCYTPRDSALEIMAKSGNAPSLTLQAAKRRSSVLRRNTEAGRSSMQPMRRVGMVTAV